MRGQRIIIIVALVGLSCGISGCSQGPANGPLGAPDPGDWMARATREDLMDYIIANGPVSGPVSMQLTPPNNLGTAPGANLPGNNQRPVPGAAPPVTPGATQPPPTMPAWGLPSFLGITGQLRVWPGATTPPAPAPPLQTSPTPPAATPGYRMDWV